MSNGWMQLKKEKGMVLLSFLIEILDIALVSGVKHDSVFVYIVK